MLKVLLKFKNDHLPIEKFSLDRWWNNDCVSRCQLKWPFQMLFGLLKTTTVEEVLEYKSPKQ